MVTIVREKNSLTKIMQLSIQSIPEKMESNRWGILKKSCHEGISHCNDADHSNSVKTNQRFFLFLLPFVAYLSGCYLFFKMPYFLYMPMLVNLKILCSDSHKFLTLSWRGPLSYRNQSIDLHSKSMDWFLYDDGLCHERVKRN